MQQFTLEIMQSRYAWPSPFVQGTTSQHEDIANILDDLIVLEILHFHVPLRGLFIPASLHAFVSKLHEPSHIVLVCDALKVIQYLRCICIELAPLNVRFETQLV